MNRDNLFLLSSFAVIIIVVLVVYIIRRNKEGYCAPCRGDIIEKPVKKPNNLRTETPYFEKFGITIKNHLNKPLKIIRLGDKKAPKTITTIRPKMYEALNWTLLDLEKGDKLRFLVDNNRVTRDYYITDIKLTPKLEVGLTTSAMLNYMSPTIFGGGSHEIQQLWIHNKGLVPLTFNGHIRVPAKTTIRYDGTGSFAPSGVAIGSTLKNDEELYDDFLIDRKISDIYYGLISKENIEPYQGSTYPPYKVPLA